MTVLLIELGYLAHVAMVPERRSKELRYNNSMQDEMSYEEERKVLWDAIELLCKKGRKEIAYDLRCTYDSLYRDRYKKEL